MPLSRKCMMLTVALLLSGCAVHDARYEQCARPDFLYCLGVKHEQCDSMFDQAKVDCKAKLDANIMFESMPDNMKEGYRVRCMADSVSTQSDKEADEVKACMRW